MQHRTLTLPLSLVLLSLVFAATLGGCAPITKERLAETLRENPQLVMDALAEDKKTLFRLVQEGAQEQAMVDEQNRRLAEKLSPFEPQVADDRPYLGADEADVVIVEYSDFLCGYCTRAAMTMKQLISQRDDVRVYFKHYVRSNNSFQLAAIFEAALALDEAKGWQLHDQFFANQQQLSKEGPQLALQLAQQVGLDTDALVEKLADPAIAQRIQADSAEAQRFGFDGTPTLVINGVSLRGAYPLEEVQKVIEFTKTPAEQTVSPELDLSSGAEPGACTDCPDTTN